MPEHYKPNAKCDSCGTPLVLAPTGYAYNPKTNKQAKRGWTNALYCSQRCDERGYMAVCSSMPGAGVCRSIGASQKIDFNRRWADAD